MDLINKYKVIIVVVLPILILVIIRSLGANYFKSDAKKWAESSFKRSNIINSGQIRTMSGEKLIVNLGREGSGVIEKATDEFYISPDSLLCKNQLKKIRDHDGPVLFFSSDPALSARIWMLISQMGFSNIYILTNNTDNEDFKNEFRSDMVTGPEL